MRVGLLTMLACSLVLCGCSGSFVLKNATADAAHRNTRRADKYCCIWLRGCGSNVKCQCHPFKSGYGAG